MPGPNRSSRFEDNRLPALDCSLDQLTTSTHDKGLINQEIGFIQRFLILQRRYVHYFRQVNARQGYE